MTRAIAATVVLLLVVGGSSPRAAVATYDATSRLNAEIAARKTSDAALGVRLTALEALVEAMLTSVEPVNPCYSR